MATGESCLGGSFGYFLYIFFSARGGGRGSPRRREGGDVDFYWKSQEGGVFRRGRARGAGRVTQRKRKNQFKTVSENDRFVKRSVGISCVFTVFWRIVSRNGPAPFLSSHFLSLHFGFPMKISGGGGFSGGGGPEGPGGCLRRIGFFFLGGGTQIFLFSALYLDWKRGGGGGFVRFFPFFPGFNWPSSGFLNQLEKPWFNFHRPPPMANPFWRSPKLVLPECPWQKSGQKLPK